MKTFKVWLEEDAPTNAIGGGDAVRGLGNVTGNPGGVSTGYAADNASTQVSIQSTVQQMMNAHNAAMTTDSPTLDGGDQPSNVLGHKGSRGDGTANYKGKK